MEWHLKTSEKELIDSFTKFISENRICFAGKQLHIWGASVRGTLLGMLLEKDGWNTFSYIDNDKRKWGKCIHGHIIISPEQVKDNPDIYVIVPIEYGEEIREQLEDWGLQIHKSFSILQPGINEKFAEEFFRKYENKYLVFGETFLNEIIIEEKNAKNLKEILWQTFGKEQMKILSMNCMGIETFYHILKLQEKLFRAPEEVWLFLNYETLTEHHHLLSRTQHVDALRLIQLQGDKYSREFGLYIQKAEDRAKNYQIELKYSPQRVSVDDKEARIQAQKDYLRQNMMYELDLHWEEGRYLRKLLQFAKEKHISVTGILVPANVSLANRYWGDAFTDIYAENTQKLQDLFTESNAHFLDLGKLLPEKYFCAEVTVNDAVYRQGMEHTAMQIKHWMYKQKREKQEHGRTNRAQK